MTKTQFSVFIKDKDYDKTGWKSTSETIFWDPWNDQAKWEPNNKNWRKFPSSKMPEHICKTLEDKIIPQYGTIITDIEAYANVNETCRTLYVTVA